MPSPVLKVHMDSTDVKNVKITFPRTKVKLKVTSSRS